MSGFGVRRFLKKGKKWIGICILCTLVLFALRFPWTETADTNIRKALGPLPLNVQFKKTALHILPPALSLNQVSLTYRMQSAPLLLDQVRIAPAWLQWLSLSKSFKVHFLKDKTDLSLTLTFRQVRKNKIKKDKIQIQARSSRLQLSLLEFLRPSMRISGETQLEFEIEGLKEDLLGGKGFFQMRGRNVTLNQILFETDFGPLNLPDIQWTEIQISARLSDGRLILEKFSLGRDGDPFFLQIKGDIELRLSRGGVRVDEYELRLFAQTERDFKLSLMDLLLMSAKTSTAKGWRYLARIRGRGVRPPDIEPILEF